MFRVWNRAPAVYLLDPLYRVEAVGHDAADILRRHGLTRAALHDAGHYVSAEEFYGVIAAFVLELGVKEVGFVQPENMHLLNSGMAGLAAMTAADIGESLAFSIEYQDLLAVPVKITQSIVGASCHLIYGEVVAYAGKVPDWLRGWAVETAMSSFVVFLRNVHLQPTRVAFDYPVPEHLGCYREAFECPLEFDAPVCEIEFPQRYLEVPQTTANPLAFTIARRQCEESIIKSFSHNDLVERIQGRVLSSTGVVPTVGEMALVLGVSVRTLQRRLHHRGTSYREVVVQARHRLACELLSETHMSVKEIAYLTGYSEAANFSAAFKALAGQSPIAFRAATKAPLESRLEK